MYFDYQKTFTKWKVGEKTFGPVYYLVLRSMLFKILNTLHLQIPDIRVDKNLENCQTQFSELSKLLFIRYIKHSLVQIYKVTSSLLCSGCPPCPSLPWSQFRSAWEESPVLLLLYKRVFRKVWLYQKPKSSAWGKSPVLTKGFQRLKQWKDL